jgi:DNA-binding LytR/AlgR family response regulator
MISMLFYSHIKRELTVFKNLSYDITCKISEDDWDFLNFSDKQLLMNFLSENPVIDISCVDVAAESGVEIAENLRSRNSHMFIIVLADSTMSPMLYIKPTIMAASLLMRPLSTELVKKVFFDVIKQYIHKYYSENGDDSFVIDNRDGRQLVPYEQIVFFESRDKKIFINTSGREYSFYDTLDSLEKRLSDKFVRCHRSFIVARTRIKKILFSQNTIILDNDCQIPLSRSYKSVFKELGI